MTAHAASQPAEPDASPPPALAPVHDFARKLRQAALRPRLEAYVRWQHTVRAARSGGRPMPAPPRWAPLSINLDLTTACNYACDHCIDFEALNQGVAHDDASLLRSLDTMTARGLRSVILIGGGEPTVYPRFASVVRHLKHLGLHVAIVTNGSRNEKILEIVDRLEAHDWIRLSLDAGTDETFQAMHKPKKHLTLEEICAGVPRLKARNRRPRIGFSFVITWRGACGESGAPLVANVDEIPVAARLARDHGFDYISFKPVLVRTPEGAEVMDSSPACEAHAALLQSIRARLVEAKALASPSFAVLESTNLKLLETGTWRAWTHQPRTCHLQALRQVLSPLGLYNCPAHRGVPKARIGEATAYDGEAAAESTTRRTNEILSSFDASHECREVTCLYHDANWWIEGLIEDPRALGLLVRDPGEDLFL